MRAWVIERHVFLVGVASPEPSGTRPDDHLFRLEVGGDTSARVCGALSEGACRLSHARGSAQGVSAHAIACSF